MTRHSPTTVMYYYRKNALESLKFLDTHNPESTVCGALVNFANDHLLLYVFAEAFTHVFPGDRINYSPARFFSDLNAELANSPAFHLWTEIPLCRYSCNFAQPPILVLSRNKEQATITAKKWVSEEQWAQTHRRFAIIRPALEDGVSQAQVARTRNIPASTIQRWVKQYREAGLATDRVVRSDKGKSCHLLAEAFALIEGLALQTPLGATISENPTKSSLRTPYHSLSWNFISVKAI